MPCKVTRAGGKTMTQVARSPTHFIFFRAVVQKSLRWLENITVYLETQEFLAVATIFCSKFTWKSLLSITLSCFSNGF